MIRKFFGKGDLFIYAMSDIVLQGEEYKEGSMISYFNGVDLALGYQLDHKTADSKRTELSYTDREPYSLTVGSVPNTAEVDKLFFKDTVDKQQFSYKTVRRYEDVQDNTIYLKESLSPLRVKMFSKGERILGELADNVVKIDEGQEYEYVDVISEFKGDGKERGFNKPELGYVRIEATVRGKFGDEDGTFILSVPLAHLVSEPVMDLSQESNYQVSLSFALINQVREEPKVVFISA